MISGIFHIPFKAENEIQNADSDESDDDENDPWLDFEEMEESDSAVRSRVPKESGVQIKDDHGKIHKCKGKFPLTQIFWRVTMKVTRGWLRSAPVYAIREDLNVQRQNLVMIFLSDCLKDARFDLHTATSVTACFDAFCKLTDNSSTLNFTNLEDILEKYILQEEQQDCCLGQHEGNDKQPQKQNHARHLHFLRKKSGLFTVVLRAASHPVLVETISRLLPYTFVQFFHQLELKRHGLRESAFHLASEMACNTPWEFMFRDIIYAKLKLQGTESTLLAYGNAGYFSRTPQTETDAIYIYEVLKTDTKKYGHTYMGFKRLIGGYYFKKLSYRISGEERWRKALEYLELNAVIKRESFNGDTNIFLYYNWRAEVDIVSGLELLLQKHKGHPLDWTIDYESSDFEKINSDPDQLRALHLIASSPITVLSGKGGCGKTTVITTLLKHICDQMEKLLVGPSEKELDHLKDETDKAKKTDGGKSPNYDPACKDGNFSICRRANGHPQGQLKLSSASCIASIYQNSAASNSNCHVNQAIVPSKDNEESEKDSLDFSEKFRLADNLIANLPFEDNEESEKDSLDFSEKFHLADNLIANMSGPSNSSHPILPVNTDLNSSDQIHSGKPQISKCERKWPLPEKPDCSKEERFMREVISDLLKIVKLAKDTDDPLLQDYKKRFLLTAPTGKAAKLLGSKANLPSATLHSVIMSWRMYIKSGSTSGWNYSTVKVLVVDECSLLSVRLFACVMNILINHAELKKVVLLGDVRQMPSIEAGNFLTDVFNAFRNVANGQVSLSLELTSNHRSESGLIVENAGKIARQDMPTFSKEQKFHLVKLTDGACDNERDEAIRHLLNNAEDVHSQVDSQFVSFRNAHCMAVNELCCRHYNQHSIKTCIGGGKERADFQIGDKICLGKNAMVSNHLQFMLDKYLGLDLDLRTAVSKTVSKQNRGQAGMATGSGGSLNTLKLNTAQALSLVESEDAQFDHTIKKMAKRDRQVEELKAERASKKLPAVVEKIATKPPLKTAASLLGEEKEKLCNGEVFFIMDEIQNFDNRLNKFVKNFVLSDKDQYCPRVVCVPFTELRKNCKMRHSWARTIHTFQGSECDSVIYVLGKAMPQNWQHVYTAVTRGKKSVYIVGNWQELHKAVSKKEYPRCSRLRHRLEEMTPKYKMTLLHDSNKLAINLTMLQDEDNSASWVHNGDTEQDLEDYIKDEQLNMENEDLKRLQEGISFNNDLNRETTHLRNINDGFNICNSLENNEATTFSDEELVIETNKTEFISLTGSETSGFNICNSLENNEATTFSDEELVFECYNTEFTLLKESGALCRSPENLSLDNNISTNPMRVQSSPKRTLPWSNSKGLFTPPKVKRTECPLNTPFRNSFQQTLMLEDKSTDEKASVQHEGNTRKNLNNFYAD